MPDPVVLIPGLQADGSSWSPILPRLMQRFPVCIPYGHQHRSSVVEMADDVLEQVPARFHLVGWSMGGYVALEILRRRPPGLASLVLVDTTDAPEASYARHRREAALAAVCNDDLRQYQRQNLRACVHDPEVLSSALAEVLLDAAEALGPAALTSQITAVVERPDSRADLATCPCPLLIVTGREDGIIPATESRRMHRQAPGSILHEIDRCGHCPPLEHHNHFASLLMDWLDRVDQDSPARLATA